MEILLSTGKCGLIDYQITVPALNERILMYYRVGEIVTNKSKGPNYRGLWLAQMNTSRGLFEVVGMTKEHAIRVMKMEVDRVINALAAVYGLGKSHGE